MIVWTRDLSRDLNIAGLELSRVNRNRQGGSQNIRYRDVSITANPDSK